MEDIKKNYKQLWRTYDKKLKKLHEENFSSFNNNIDYFITYLKFLRDYYILSEPLTIGEKDNTKITSIVAAISEYEASKKCEKLEEKEVHWVRFWQVVAFNIEDWTRSNNVTIQQNNIA